MKKTPLFRVGVCLCLMVFLLQSCQQEVVELPNSTIIKSAAPTTTIDFLETSDKLTHSTFCPFEDWELKMVSIPEEVIAAYAKYDRQQTATNIINFPPRPIGQPNWAQSFQVIEVTGTPIYLTTLVTSNIPFPTGFLIIYQKEKNYQFLKIGNPSYIFQCVQNILP
ncbi:MAG: hypothetical protein AAGJ18_22855 [Bacteroidota bacterium]